MDFKGVAIVWAVGAISIWIIGALVMTAISSAKQPEPSEGLLMSILLSPELILAAMEISNIFTPCCYCYGKSNE
ncbi:MAG: hypothetical protein EAX95_13555 [Candidatus Thorarchaeota archaeon]|nr:hypothetical protein [Candidatus Thorarchaeota archaeon]